MFNWLYARHTGGTFVLRVEDTDDARNTREAVDVILDGLRWLGLDWDEGPVSGDAMQESKGDRGPYFQSQRGEIYQRRIRELLDKDLAYEHEGAVKFRMTREPVTIPDVVAGDVIRKLTDREEADPDFVIVRSDGKPVFHLVNVVDDIEMGGGGGGGASRTSSAARIISRTRRSTSSCSRRSARRCRSSRTSRSS